MSQCEVKDPSRKGKGKSQAKPRGRNDSANVARNDASTSTGNMPQGSTNVSMMAANDDSCFSAYDWLADCATISHIAHDRRFFSHYQEIDQTITSIGRTQVKAIGCGTITLKTVINGETKYITLYDVLHVPTASNNLLSVGRYVKFGGKFEAEDDEAHFYSPRPRRQLMITGKRIDTLFRLNVKVQINETYVAKPGLPTWLDWHKRFGHIGVTGLRYLPA